MLLKYTIIMVTEAPKDMVEAMHMKYAASIDEALAMAKAIVTAKGVSEPKITVIPDGVSVIVKE
jgi:nickel-dependent lactate racemase